MSIIGNFFKALFSGDRGAQIQKQQEAPTQTRGFDAARASRLTNDWNASQTSMDYDLRNGLQVLINRSRSLAQNGSMGEGYLKLLERNVLGATPFVLQSKIFEADGVTRRPGTTVTLKV